MSIGKVVSSIKYRSIGAHRGPIMLFVWVIFGLFRSQTFNALLSPFFVGLWWWWELVHQGVGVTRESCRAVAIQYNMPDDTNIIHNECIDGQQGNAFVTHWPPTIQWPVCSFSYALVVGFSLPTKKKCHPSSFSDELFTIETQIETLFANNFFFMLFSAFHTKINNQQQSNSLSMQTFQMT